MICCFAVALGQDLTFYDAIKKDPAHKLIMKAIDADTTGETKRLLTHNMPVTALVPTDAVSGKAQPAENAAKTRMISDHCT